MYTSPKKDYIFKKIFNNEKEGYLKDFLEALLDEEVENIEVLHSTVLEKESKQNKYCILDVVAKVEGCYIHLEMQNRIEKDFEQRVTYYENKMVSYLGKSGESYKK